MQSTRSYTICSYAIYTISLCTVAIYTDSLNSVAVCTDSLCDVAICTNSLSTINICTDSFCTNAFYSYAVYMILLCFFCALWSITSVPPEKNSPPLAPRTSLPVKWVHYCRNWDASLVLFNATSYIQPQLYVRQDSLIGIQSMAGFILNLHIVGAHKPSRLKI